MTSLITNSSVNPVSLFYSQAAAPSPSPSLSDSTSRSNTNSRKRPRTDFQSSEERKEARAERNRIAAQVSRDRRKAEFTDLRDRVASLERENAILRSSSSLSTTSSSSSSSYPLSSDVERENRELKERVRVLESALATLSQNVVNALQGLSNSTTTQTPTSLIPTTPASTISNTASEASLLGSFPSSTRHLAAGGNSVAKTSLFEFTPSSTISPVNANTEDWLRAILDSSSIATANNPSTPSSTSTFLPPHASSPSSASSADSDLSQLLHTPILEPNSPLLTLGTSHSPTLSMINGGSSLGSLFSGESEMDKLLAMLPDTPDLPVVGVTPAEDMWMSSWLKEEPIVPDQA